MSEVRTYYYRIIDPHGKMRTGFYELGVAQDTSARLRLEGEFGGTVVSLLRLPAPVTGFYKAIKRVFARSVRADDCSSFLRDLAVMQSAGVPTLEALRTIIHERRGSGAPAIAQIAKQLYDDMDAGVPISDAFNRRPDIFSETVRNLIAIGDRSGTVDRMLMEAADHTERVINIRRNIQTALIYPAFVFSTLFAVMAFWISYVVPKLGDLFERLDADLPPITRWLLSFADTVSSYFEVVLLGLAAFVCALLLLYRHHEPTRRSVHTALHYTPVSKRIVTASGMAAMTEHLAILVRSGLDIVASLDILQRTTRDLYYKRRLGRMSEAVQRGEPIGGAMRLAGGFPPMAVRMISVGEESGSLDTQLNYLAREYRSRLDTIIGSLSEIIKPVIVILAGGLLVFMVVALLMPIYDLIRQTMAMQAGGV